VKTLFIPPFAKDSKKPLRRKFALGPQLKRVLGFWPVFSACFGIAISASTLMLLGNAFGISGMPFILSQSIALIIMILVVLAFSELSTIFPVAGGIEAYTREALGLGPAATVTLWYFVATISLATNTLVDGSLLNIFLPGIPPLGWAIILVTIYLIFNLLGAKVIGFGQGFFTLIVIASYLLMGILAFAGIGGGSVDFSRLKDWSGLSFSSVFNFAIMAFWLFVGIEMATPLAEEVKNPQKTLPKAMIAGLITIFLIQLVLGPAMYGTLKPEELTSFTPHVSFAEKLFGNFGLIWVLILQLSLEFTTIGGVMFGISRIIYGLGRDKMLPGIFALLHPKFGTPWASLFLIYIAVIIAMIFGAPLQLLSIASMIFLLIYALVFIDLWILRRKKPDLARPFYAGGPFNNPTLAVAGILAIFGVIVGNSIQDPSIISIGLPVAAFCFLIAMIAAYFRKTKETAVK